MTTLTPPWYCDVCDEAITDPEHGLVVWDNDNQGNVMKFHLVHKNMHGLSCDPQYPSSLVLTHLLGPTGREQLLSFLSVGPLKQSTNRPQINDFDDFVDLFRRLQSPYYEEARRKFDDEHVQYWLDDANEYYPYLPETLKRIVDGTLG